MILGIATAQNRISPVFDCAEHFSIFYIENGIVKQREDCRIPATTYMEKLATLNQLGVECIICGAISRELLDIVILHGIEILPWISGDVEEILHAFCNDGIADTKYSMPGCLKGQRRCHCHKRSGSKQYL